MKRVIIRKIAIIGMNIILLANKKGRLLSYCWLIKGVTVRIVLAKKGVIIRIVSAYNRGDYEHIVGS